MIRRPGTASPHLEPVITILALSSPAERHSDAGAIRQSRNFGRARKMEMDSRWINRPALRHRHPQAA